MSSVKGKYYTGIGSRKTPKEICNLMTIIASSLSDKGWTLRSGGAGGADIAFEKGSKNSHIYLPWKGFNGNSSELFKIDYQAYNIARTYHPSWNSLSDAGKKLMARNSYQILGLDFKTPSKFVICWTENGKMVGGTSQALRIAKHYDIPIFNLGNEQTLNDIDAIVVGLLGNI